MSLKWKYTNVHHSFRASIGLSLNEYAVLDIYFQNQSHPKSTKNGWAKISFSEIGDFLVMGSSTVSDIVDFATSVGLMEVMGDKGNRFRRTTPDWYNFAYLDDCEDMPQDALSEILRKVQDYRAGKSNSRNPAKKQPKSGYSTLVVKEEEKDLRPKSNFPEPLRAEKEKEEIGDVADSVRYTPSDEIKMAMSRADLKARIAYVLNASWCKDFPKRYGRSKQNLAMDVLNEIMDSGGFVGDSNAALRDWIEKFINNRTKKSSERTFSEETTAIVNDLIERTLNASPYNKLMQPLRDFERTKIAEWVESKPGIYHWYAFDTLIDLFSRLGGGSEYLTVSNALGKYAEDNKEMLKIEYNKRLKNVGLK